MVGLMAARMGSAAFAVAVVITTWASAAVLIVTARRAMAGIHGLMGHLVLRQLSAPKGALRAFLEPQVLEVMRLKALVR